MIGGHWRYQRLSVPASFLAVVFSMVVGALRFSEKDRIFNWHIFERRWSV